MSLIACAEPETVAPEEVSTPERTAYTETYPSGKLKMKGWMQGDKRVGRWIAFYENGVRWSENEYRDGRKNGPTKTYYDTGLLKYKGYYIEDEEAGTWNFYDETGKLVEKKDFNE